ncbi:unnamed protein product [Adineta ricciae]|uniref:Uncharacterized protein n=1 Tax=Adineta ricciae TaxID=249248 RepID=A0A814H4H6_ADIRI|nr:unnamed protein product [Adineta ricciae]
MLFVENFTTTYNNDIITTDEPLTTNITEHVLCHPQEKKRKEFLKDEKTWAHPFEDILVVVDEIKSVELTEIRPTTTIPT